MKTIIKMMMWFFAAALSVTPKDPTDQELTGHRRPRKVIKVMSEEFIDLMKGKIPNLSNTNQEDNLHHRLTNPGEAMHYMVVGIDTETGRPYVRKRIFTNMHHQPIASHQLYEGEHLVPINVGDNYSMAFMEEYLGDIGWRVEFIPTGSESLSNYPDAAYAFVDEATTTIITIPSHPYWGALTDITGIRFRPSLKLPKRSKNIVAVRRFARRFDPETVNYGTFTPSEEKAMHYDGQMVVRRSFIMKFARTAEDRRILRHAKTGYLTGFTSEGMFKGDFIIAADDELLDYDLYGSDDNLKSELWLERGGETFFQFFLHHEHHTPVTDIQSLTWLNEVVFPIDELADELARVGDKVKEDLLNGEFPTYLTNYIDSDLGSLDLDEAGTLADLKLMYNRWLVEGNSLNESAHFIYMIAGAFINKMRAGMRFPLPWGFRTHVTTHEMLEMAGYTDFESFVEVTGYHHGTGRLSLPGKLFMALYTNHGGWDLDDSVLVLIRKFSTDGIKGLLIRSPNAYGEYSIVDIDTSTLDGVIYNTEGEIPDIGVTVKEFKDICPPIQRVNQHITYLGMPEGDTLESWDPKTIDEIISSFRNSPSVGQWANSQMVYWATMSNVNGKEFRRVQLAPTEDIVDTLTQSINAKGFAAIDSDIKATWAELLRYGKAETYFMKVDRRIPKKVREKLSCTDGYITRLWAAHNSYLNSFAEWAITESNHSRVLIEDLLNIDLEPKWMDWAAKAWAWIGKVYDDAPRGSEYVFTDTDSFEGATRMLKQRAYRDHFRLANRELVSKIMGTSRPSNAVIALYQYSAYKQQFNNARKIDAFLFLPSFDGEPSVMDLLIAEIRNVRTPIV